MKNPATGRGGGAIRVSDEAVMKAKLMWRDCGVDRVIFECGRGSCAMQASTASLGLQSHSPPIRELLCGTERPLAGGAAAFERSGWRSRGWRWREET
jgi:hypothetical protein